MNNKTKTMIVIAAAGLVFLGVSATRANAQSVAGKSDEMVSALAKKLGVPEDKVKTAFNSIRNEKQAEMRKAFVTRLDQAVKDKKLTETQKQTLLQKHDEMQKSRENEMTDKLKRHDDLRNWAEKEGIDLSQIFGGFGGRMKMRMMR